MSQYLGNEVITASLGDSLKKDKPDWKAKVVTPKNIITAVGSGLLCLLCVVPIWNAMVLMQDSNYVFWAGRSTPQWMIVLCVAIIFLYVAMVSAFFTKAKGAAQSEHTIMMIAFIFTTLFGLFLMMISLPLTHQSELTYTNLLHRCDYSEQTQRLFQYSQVLQNMRADPACATKFSVEECAGYEEAAPYTNFLKGMENNFRCAGFCYKPPPVAMNPSAGLLSVKQHVRHRHTDHITKISLIAEGAHSEAADSEVAELLGQSTYVYPPTLFSTSNFQASCEGMAARDMKYFAGDIGQQTFFQGIYLILIAIMTGFLKLTSFCVRPK